MRAFVFFFFVILAMAAARKVNVVDYNPEQGTNQVQVVDFNPDYDQSQVQVVESNPEYDASHASSSDNTDQVIIPNPDSAFSQPSNGPSGGYEPISTGPAFVSNTPAKQYDNPYARGGK